MSTSTPLNKKKVTVCNPKPIDLQGLLLQGHSTPLNEDQVSVTARLLVDCRCHLGECVLYEDRTNTILFVSILDRTFHKLDLDDTTSSSALKTYSLPKMIGAFGLLETPSEEGAYLVAWEDGFQLYNLETNTPLSAMSQGEAVNGPLGCLPDRLNDGRVDPTGKRFLCGGCSAGTNNSGPLKVYQCEYNAQAKQLQHTPVVDAIQVTNSICWSLDGKTMYLADSPTMQIHQYDYHNDNDDDNNDDGSSSTLLSNKRHFHDKPTGFADGSCVDAQGYVWNATWRQGDGTAMVHRIDPTNGQIVFTVYLPDTTSEASCCCFGGPNLDILFITTAWEHLDPASERHAGGLYAVQLPAGMTGLPEKRFITE
jgi:L-arabinonolactonase